VSALRYLAARSITNVSDDIRLLLNAESLSYRKNSTLINNIRVKERMGDLPKLEILKRSDFRARKNKQREILNLPLFPSTTIGSFPPQMAMNGSFIVKKSKIICNIQKFV